MEWTCENCGRLIVFGGRGVTTLGDRVWHIDCDHDRDRDLAAEFNRLHQASVDALGALQDGEPDRATEILGGCTRAFVA
jgi:hypothetical protein